MSITWILQIALNLFFLVALFAIYKKLTKKPQEDPRLSRGLQLLQSKISILEDLSDRTDKQVDQLIRLLEQKAHEVQKNLRASDDQIRQLELSMNKSREVAGLFEDKIPHHEVIERESSVKYIKAAQMAYKGHSAEEISQELGLSQGEADFIVKVNKDELMFDEQMLPEWAKVSLKKLNKKSVNYVDDQFSKFDIGFEEPKKDIDEMKKLGDAFRQACKDVEIQQQEDKTSSDSPINQNENPQPPPSTFIPIKNLGVTEVEFKKEPSASDEKTESP